MRNMRRRAVTAPAPPVSAAVAAPAPADADWRYAQKMEALGRLATGVAHDFNNLLTVISGYSQLLLQRLGAGHDGAEELRQIHRASERGAAFTRQLLKFGGKRESPPEVLDLNAVVADHARLLRPLVGENIELRTELAPDLPPVQASPGQLLQILLNLAANARDAMPQGGALTLATALATAPAAAPGPQVAGSWSGDTPLPPGDAGDRSKASPSLPATRAPAGPPPAAAGRTRVVLCVSDTGCGMDEPVRARIFEPYFSTKSAGLGLGLATVAELARELGGEVRADSRPGGGSTFTLALPAAAAPQTAPTPADLPAGGCETVLLVEDAEPVRALVERVLAGQGFRVLAAAGGDEALALMRQGRGPVDLLITDVVMPGMGGQELADRLQAVRPGLRVLFVSGYGADLLGSEEAAGRAFLPKPFTPNQLLRKAREVLSA
jgi:signal transduction histidine kinase